MPVDQKILDALNVSELKSKLPRNPKVVDIRVEEYVDTDGEDALRVWIIIGKSVKVEKLKGEDLNAWHFAIRQRIRDLGVTLWPYIGFVKQTARSMRTTNEPA